MQELKLIYDFADRVPRIGFMLFPLVFVAIGLGIFYYHKNLVNHEATSKLGINRRKYGMVFGIFFASFAGLISAFVILSTLSEYFKTKKVYDSKEYQIVEGKLNSIIPCLKVDTIVNALI